VGDGDKEELDAELWRNKGVRREVIIKMVTYWGW
jgi:hypothetical protein